jgi:hypothetical protein
MKIQELFDIDRFIKVNDLKEVTTQRIEITQNIYHPQGLFSEEIFGQTADERDYRCAYIKLPIHVFNPNIASTIIARSGGIIKKLAYGEVRCNLVDGKLVADEEGQYCGLKDLYDIWDNIDIGKTLNTRDQDKFDILSKSPKRLLFNDKVLVLPPNMRPQGLRNGRKVKSELNTIYMHILGLKSVTSHTTTNNVYQVYNKFQDAVVDIYQYVNKFIGSKTGFLQQQLLAKTTTFTARNVISAPRYNSDTPTIGIFKTGYPMHTLCSLFQPFVKFHMKQFLSYSTISTIHPTPQEVNRNDLVNIYDDKMISDLLHIYMKNPGSRFMILYLDPEKTKPIIFEAYDIKKKEKISRPMTLTDVIYLCCKRGIVDANRMVYTVRYPIGDYMGAFFTKVHILSTVDTTDIEYMGETLYQYPVVDLNASHMRVSTMFADTITPSNSRLKAIGGDYDGDTVKSTGIWSDEANRQAEELMMSKIYNITPQGTTMFPIEIECLNGLYALTKRKGV